MFKDLNIADLGVLALYFLGILVLAVWVYVQERKAKATAGAASGYFLGGRNLSWFAIGASLFASNIGSEHLVGLAGAGAAGDFAAGQFEILASLIIILLGWIFVPLYLKSGVFTMPEFLEKRFSPWCRAYLSWVSIVGYILTKISVTIAAGGIIFTALLGIDFWTGAIIIVVLTGLYTVAGGLKVVVYTDLAQMLVLIGGAIAVTYYGFQELGPDTSLTQLVSGSHLSLWRTFDDPDFPWTGILLGAPILGVWYWCTDQFIVQRVLAAKDVNEARKGTIFASYLKLLPIFLFVLPGVIAFALASQPDSNFAFPVENGKVQYDAALPLITMNILPHGLKGLVIAGLLAALMSSLSSVFNSCSTLFTIDIYKKYFPKTQEKQLVQVGRIATVILVALGIAWIPFLRIIEGGLFQKLQSIQAYISPPIAAVFLLGIFNKRLNEHGAKWALITGAVLGSIRLIFEIMLQKGYQFPELIEAFAAINFLHFAFFLFVICALVLVIVSQLKEGKVNELVADITYDKSKKIPLSTTHKILIVGVLIAVAIVWIYFS